MIESACATLKILGHGGEGKKGSVRANRRGGQRLGEGPTTRGAQVVNPADLIAFKQWSGWGGERPRGGERCGLGPEGEKYWECGSEGDNFSVTKVSRRCQNKRRRRLDKIGEPGKIGGKANQANPGPWEK